MKVTCEKCQKTFDDAQHWTICAHDLLMHPEALKQRDRALSLLGKKVVFNHMPDAEGMRVESVSWDGMITVAGMNGQFAPSLFSVKASA